MLALARTLGATPQSPVFVRLGLDACQCQASVTCSPKGTWNRGDHDLCVLDPDAKSPSGIPHSPRLLKIDYETIALPLRSFSSDSDLPSFQIQLALVYEFLNKRLPDLGTKIKARKDKQSKKHEKFQKKYSQLSQKQFLSLASIDSKF